MQKLLICFIALVVLIGCSNTAKDVTTITPNYSTALNEGDYRFVKSTKLSKARDTHRDRQRSKTDIDAINRGMMEISKLYFSPREYVLNELDILSYDRLTKEGNLDFDDVALLNYTSAENPYGLNPEKDKEMILGNVKVKGPALITDIFELDFVKNNDKETKISGLSTTIVLDPKPTNQEQKDVTIDEETLIAYGKSASDKLHNYLSTLPQLSGIPVVVSLFMAKSNDSKTPGRFVGYTTYANGKSKFTAINEQYYYLGDDNAKTQNADLNNLFTVYRNELNSILYESVGVVGLVRSVDGKITHLSIEVNAQFKSFVEEEIMIQKINESFNNVFKNKDYTVRISLNDRSTVKALFERKVNSSTVTFVRR